MCFYFLQLKIVHRQRVINKLQDTSLSHDKPPPPLCNAKMTILLDPSKSTTIPPPPPVENDFRAVCCYR